MNNQRGIWQVAFPKRIQARKTRNGMRPPTLMRSIVVMHPVQENGNADHATGVDQREDNRELEENVEYSGPARTVGGR